MIECMLMQQGRRLTEEEEEGKRRTARSTATSLKRYCPPLHSHCPPPLPTPPSQLPLSPPLSFYIFPPLPSLRRSLPGCELLWAVSRQALDTSSTYLVGGEVLANGGGSDSKPIPWYLPRICHAHVCHGLGRRVVRCVRREHTATGQLGHQA